MYFKDVRFVDFANFEKYLRLIVTLLLFISHCGGLFLLGMVLQRVIKNTTLETIFIKPITLQLN